MLKDYKKPFFILLNSFVLAACVSSAEVNQQSEHNYTQEINKMKVRGKIDYSSTTAKRIHSIFEKMVPYADRENHTNLPFKWQINVIKSDQLNAWAMPGGKMAFYTGLVDRLKLTNDEIATVMGHEMAHALKEHGKSQTNFGIVTNIAAQLTHVALSTTIGEDASGLAVGLVKDYALDKPYSRRAETEADEVGLMLMAKSGFNPQAAPGLWDKMKTASDHTGGVLATLSSTHPTDESRQENLRRLLPKAIELYKSSK